MVMARHAPPSPRAFGVTRTHHHPPPTTHSRPTHPRLRQVPITAPRTSVRGHAHLYLSYPRRLRAGLRGDDSEGAKGHPSPPPLHKHWFEGGGGVVLRWPLRTFLAKLALNQLLSDTMVAKLCVVAHISRSICSNGRICVGQSGTSPSVDLPTPPPHQHPGVPPNPHSSMFLAL